MELPQQIGTWKVVRRLGAGGMGTVFEVIDASGTVRALKLLNVLEEAATRRLTGGGGGGSTPVPSSTT